MTKEELIKHWKPCGCSDFKEIEGIGLCAIHKYAFTYGLVSNLDEYSYEGRWCYPTYEEAQLGLKHWDGKGDPLGMWIKYKGDGGEYSNFYRPEFNPKWDKKSPHLKD